jgi:hypothetical protein
MGFDAPYCPTAAVLTQGAAAESFGEMSIGSFRFSKLARPRELHSNKCVFL